MYSPTFREFTRNIYMDTFRNGGGLPSGFITQWKTDNAGTSANNEITLPLTTGPNTFDVDWGDGNSDFGVTQTTPLTHTYSSSGTYTVIITGTINGWRFNNGGDKDKLISILQWGPLKVGDLNGYFNGCSNLVVTAQDILNTTGMTNFANFFRDCISLTTVPSLDLWDTSLVTNVIGMFWGASLFNQDILNGFNTVTTAARFLQNATSFNGVITGFGNMTGAFSFLSGASSFNRSISGIDFSSLENANQFFKDCVLFDQAVPSMPSLKNAIGIFWGCSVFNQPLTNLNFSAVTTANSMLRDTTLFNQSLANLDVSAMTSATDFMLGSSISRANYDATLIAWDALTLQNNVSIDFGSSQYTNFGAAATARTNIINTYSWTIIDGGPFGT